MNRRRLLLGSLAAIRWRARAAPKYRVVMIGDTGHGNYGHEWDTAWKQIPEVELAAVADPDEAGRAAALKRSGAARGYADYRKMLETEKPQIVAICPRWADQRVAMVSAAAAAGAHILLEKPFAASVEDADKMVDAVERAHVKVQVGHVARPDPVTSQARTLLRGGAIGELMEMRARGKEDRRAGGEDMIVLGTHCFDLMRFLAGDPEWVFAHVTTQSHEVARGSGRRPTEPVGIVAGDNISAMFGFGHGAHGYFGSKASDVTSGARFGVTLYGSRGAIFIPLSRVPQEPAMISRSTNWAAAWEVLPPPPETVGTTRTDANVRMVRDLLDAIAKDREPICSARDGRWAVEMVEGVYQSQLVGARVIFPLRDRHTALRVGN